ncbi:MAG: glycosyltransferase [Deltaproteobacteria bacterium]|nr:glycosyltransferase [Deltaproteobacteria bacterium]
MNECTDQIMFSIFDMDRCEQPMIDAFKYIRLLFFLPSIQAYPDRVHMIDQIAQRVGKAVLLVGRHDMDPSKAGIEHMRVVEVRRRGKLDKLPLAASKMAMQLIRDENINVMHDTFGILSFLFLYRRRFPQIIFVSSLYNLAEWELKHTLRPYCSLSNFIKFRNFRQYLKNVILQRAVCLLADCVIVQAPGLEKRLIAQTKIPQERVAWIPNSVANWPGLSPWLDRQYSEKIRLLYVRGFSVTTGFDVLLSVLDLARSKGIPLQATAIGEYASIDELYLRKRVRHLDLGDMLLLKLRVDHAKMLNYFDVSDWLFHVSELDGSPRIVLEALAHGLPVIGSNHPGITVLDPLRQFIAFAEQDNPKHILQIAMTRVIDPKGYQKRSQIGAAYVAEHFSSQAISQRHIDLYAELLNRNNKGGAFTRGSRDYSYT